MKAILLLRQDADPCYWGVFPEGRIPTQEHFAEVIVDGESCFLVDAPRLSYQQRIAIQMLLCDRGLTTALADLQIRGGVPVPWAQARAMEVDADTIHLDECSEDDLFYAYPPESTGFDFLDAQLFEFDLEGV
ncbi:hypothetical protein GS597_01315 [Synechococcales cyanobacterium C]|uniref:Uncharacterized protein n=1 Tax=Petrachloros mirabilis ULC683 TaxID=2781853 RepID=A0A8K2ANA6_9CYAN|nr:hypothetical protein [Petrachloros mirabilis]NCJ05178.1 hypothetical protein [Petrachloros mirabilis ULC683]